MGTARFDAIVIGTGQAGPALADRLARSGQRAAVMNVNFVPEHLVVGGGSYIGLEFGQMYRRCGSRVTLVVRGPRLVGREEDVFAEVQAIVEREGIAVRRGAKCLAPRPRRAASACRVSRSRRSGRQGAASRERATPASGDSRIEAHAVPCS